MSSVTDLAIILKAQPFQERSQIVTALTRHHGKITALARNSIQSRRFGSTLGIFSVSEWKFKFKTHSDSNLQTLEATTPKDDFSSLQKQYDVFVTASYFNELLLKVAPDQMPCEDLFKLHFNTLNLLNKLSTQSNLELIKSIFAIKMLQWSGVQPDFKSCRDCGTALLEIDERARLFTRVAQAGWSCCRDEAITDTYRSMPSHLTRDTITLGLMAMTQPMRTIFEDQVAQHLIQDTALNTMISLRIFCESLLFFYTPGLDPSEIKSLGFNK